MDAKARAQLTQLLLQVSDDDAVRGFAKSSLPIGVNWDAIAPSIADDVQRLPSGTAAAPFFARIVAAFPTRAAEVEQLARLWRPTRLPEPELVGTPWFRELPLDFTRTETRRAEAVLTKAYPTRTAVRRLAENIGLDLAALDDEGDLKDFVRELLRDASGSDRLLNLLNEVFGDESKRAYHLELWPLVQGYETDLKSIVLSDRPSLATLGAIPPVIEISTPGGTTMPAPGALEQLINAEAGFSDVPGFLRELAAADARTARVLIGGHPAGTGFLVGNALLLTNYHVAASIQVGSDVTVEFDGPQAGGRKLGLADTNWMVCQSTHRSKAEELGADGPASGAWDYALLRLREDVGGQPLGPTPNGPGQGTRGWYQLEPENYTFELEEPLLIVGHPKGLEVTQLSLASPSRARLTKSGTRVRYLTNTEAGSSGSPVFNKKWRVVALHHGAGPTKYPGELDVPGGDFNQGIPVALIAADLRAQLADRPTVLTELGLQ